jgi:hypothetical protein
MDGALLRQGNGALRKWQKAGQIAKAYKKEEALLGPKTMAFTKTEPST